MHIHFIKLLSYNSTKYAVQHTQQERILNYTDEIQCNKVNKRKKFQEQQN